MSSFGGYNFKVVPSSGFFPVFESDDQLIMRWKGAVVVESQDALVGLRALRSVFTTKRPLGSNGYVIQIEYGGVYTLTVPAFAGTSTTVQALLSNLTSPEVFGLPSGNNQQYKCNLEFVAASAVSA